MEKISIRKQDSYEGLSKYLIDKIDMNNIQIYSYNDFICNKIKRYMERTYDQGLFQVRFIKWWVDDSGTIPLEECKSKHLSHEVSLKALTEITFSKDFSDRKLNIPSSSVTVEVEVARFPQLTKSGNFVINGVDKILISHLEKADKIFLRAPDPKDPKQKGQLELITRNGQSLIMSRAITFKNVIFNKGARTHNMSFIKALNELGFLDEESIFNKVGVNSFFLSKIGTNLTLSEDKNARLIDILRSFNVGVEDRQGINKRLSFIRNLTGKMLATDISYIHKGETYTLERYHIVTRSEAKEMQEAGLTTVKVLEKGSEVPILNNGFINASVAFSTYDMPVPSAFLVKSRNPLDCKKSMEYYLSCNKVELDKLYKEYGSDKEKFQSQINLNMDKLIGYSLCKDDLLAMINLFSRSLLHLEEYDDIDSLENKKIINISDIFEKGLAEAIGVPSKYNANTNTMTSSLLSRLEAEVKRIKNSTNEAESALETMLRFDFASILKQPYSITAATSKNPLFSIEDSTNPLAQINHKRRITLQYVQDFGGIQSMSPDPTARQNNPSYSGRIDCVETPEGQSVGLVRQYGALSYLNEFGQIEAPYLRVNQETKEIDLSCIYYMTYDEEIVFNRVLSPNIATNTGVAVEYFKGSQLIDTEFFETAEPVKNLKPYEKIAKSKMKKVGATSYSIKRHKKNWFIDEHVAIIKGHGHSFIDTPDKVEYVSCSGEHIFSPVTAAIPFIEFDDAARGMMGSVMSKQAIPIYGKQQQYVRTKMAHAITPTATGVITAPYNLMVEEVCATYIKVRNLATNETEYFHCLRQDKTSKKTLNKSIPIVKVGDYRLAGEVLADSTSTLNGELAHGTQARVAVMAWDGDNYEDGVIFSDRMVKDDVFTSIHLEYYELHLGRDQVVNNKADLYNHKDAKNNKYTCRYSLEDIKSNKYTDAAVIKPWTQVKPNDILSCKVILKEKKGTSRVDVTNQSAQEYVVVPLKYTGNVPGTVVDVDVYNISKDEMCYLIKIAFKEKVSGDKYTGRHGNKGIICSIYPEEDMPYDEVTGERPDIVINPLGIPSRMNIGQNMDGQLGTVCHDLGLRAEVKTLANMNVAALKEAIRLANADKHQLRDGRTGKKLRYATLVTLPYVEKLEHRVSKKIHARSSKPYTTRRQPTQGKAQNGGQRLGEMEFWSLMALGAVNLCREFTMYKTDDVDNRNAFLDALEGSTEPDWKSVVERKQNVSYAFQRTDVYCKSMFRNIHYWDKDGNEIDITGSANSSKAGVGRDMGKNSSKVKEDSKFNTAVKKFSVLDIVEEDDEDEEYSLEEVLMSTNQSSPTGAGTENNFVYIPMDMRDQEGYGDVLGNHLQDDLEDEVDDDTIQDKGTRLVEEEDLNDEPAEDGSDEDAF